MTEKSTVIRLRATPKLKTKLQNEAQNRGVTDSELLRSLIIGLSETTPEKVKLAVETEIHRLTLRLPKILLNAAKIKAGKKDMTLTRWIESLIQVVITKKTVLSEVELSELRESNRQLLAIGRNINQISKGVNASLQFSIEQKLLSELAEKIDNNSKVICAFMKASHNTWE